MNRVLLRALVAACASAFMLLGAASALAGNGNAGDVWVDTFGVPPGPGHEMDPHLPCANISLWASGLADSSGSYTIDGWSPSGSQELDYGPKPWSYSGSGTKLLDTILVQTLITNAVDHGDAPINKQGFHFKLQFSQDPQKHKTFWVNCTVPTMTTQASSGTVGGSIHDTATIAGSNAATGTITWNVYNLASDPTCMKPLNTSVLSTTVNGNGTYNSPNFPATTPGTYQWIATYSGDAKNLTVAGICGDTREQSVVSSTSPTNPPGTNPPRTGTSGGSPTTVSLLGASAVRCGGGTVKTTKRVHGKTVVACVAKKKKKHVRRHHHHEVVVVRRTGPEFTG